MLSFQRLDVYQRSIQFLAVASELVEELPRGNAERADQRGIELLEAVVAMLTKMITVESST